MDFLQNFIHKVELEGGMRYLRTSLVALAVVMLTVGYNWRAFRNLSSPEGMDNAQLARNLAQGQGYTTLLIRPFSIHLVKKHYQEKHGFAPPGETPDEARIKSGHPDLANPPVYPVLLAGLLKILHSNYVAYDRDNPKPFWTSDGRFFRYQADFFIALLNQALFLAVVALVYLLARRLFDSSVAWLSALLVLGTELLWRFTMSGLSTILLLLIFMGVIWALVLVEEETREPRRGPIGLLVLAVVAGALVGAGGLTRYAFVWMIVPVLAFLGMVSGRQRVVLMAGAFGAFVAVMTPWVARNYAVGGLPFGTATSTILEGTGLFPGHQLQRSLDPNFNRGILHPVWQKLLINIRLIVQGDLPKLGGSWVSAFFLVGLMVRFPSPAARRLRQFLIMSLLMLALAQALGKTQISEDMPEINSENLLVLLVPLVLVFGVSLFFVLLDQVELAFRELRYVILAGFAALACLPLIFAFLPPRTSPVAYPPYYPPMIQNVFGSIKEEELTMSDIPWAVAWYGKRQCAWLTLNCQSEFYGLHDYLKPVHALYLSRVTMDGKFLTQWQPADDQSWGNLILQTVSPRNSAERLTELTLGPTLRRSQNPAEFRIEPGAGPDKKNLPANFPLRLVPGSYPEQFIMLDWERRRRG